MCYFDSISSPTVVALQLFCYRSVQPAALRSSLRLGSVRFSFPFVRRSFVRSCFSLIYWDRLLIPVTHPTGWGIMPWFISIFKFHPTTQLIFEACADSRILDCFLFVSCLSICLCVNDTRVACPVWSWWLFPPTTCWWRRIPPKFEGDIVGLLEIHRSRLSIYFGGVRTTTLIVNQLFNDGVFSMIYK